LAPQNIGVSVLCPGLVRSKIYQSENIRPPEFAGSGYDPNDEFTQRLEEVHKIGMDPMEVAEKVLRGIKRNDLYIFSHPDHKQEVRELCEEIMAAFPDEEPEPQRMAFEDFRRKQKAEVKAKGNAVLSGR
jgi:short-subunit dehydrogenase